MYYTHTHAGQWFIECSIRQTSNVAGCTIVFRAHVWNETVLCMPCMWLCVVPKAYIIGFTNYKAASLWCCAKLYSEGSSFAKHSKKSLSITLQVSSRTHTRQTCTNTVKMKKLNVQEKKFWMNQLAVCSDGTFAHFFLSRCLVVHKVASYFGLARPCTAHTYISMNINIFNNFVFCFIFHTNGWWNVVSLRLM